MMDNIIIRVLTRVFDFIVLNVLWVLCSVPIITIGASTTALYSMMLKIVANEEGYIIRGFFEDFKKNFRQSTLVWMILVILGIILRMDFAILCTAPERVAKIGNVLLGIVALFYLSVVSFVFPLIARFENSTFHMIKNAILIPVSRLPYACLVLFTNIICVVLTFLNQMTIVVGAAIWSVIGVALVVYVDSVFIKSMLKPYVEEQEK